MYTNDWITETVKIEHDGAHFIVELRKAKNVDNAQWQVKTLRTIGEYENKNGTDISVWLAVHAPEAFGQIVRRAIMEVNRL